MNSSAKLSQKTGWQKFWSIQTVKTIFMEEKEPIQDKEVEQDQVIAENTEENQAKANEDSSAQLSEVKKELDEMKDKYLRLYSDFDNFRRRTAKERIEIIQSASKDLIVDLLPVLDDFERALIAFEKHEDFQATIDGIVLIQSKLVKTLENKGLSSFNSKESDFNTELHEAITEVPAPDESLKGKVVDEVEKGYYLHDKVIRFAKVIVGK